MSGSTCLVRYTGRRSGRMITTPTQYVRRGNDVIIMVGHSEQKTWWRNFRVEGEVDLLLQRTWTAMTARAIVGAEEPETVAPLLDAYLKRFPKVSAPARSTVMVWCHPRQVLSAFGAPPTPAVVPRS
jgi:deazaflavin-dependent oxidoreductase (nitroreductase family)